MREVAGCWICLLLLTFTVFCTHAATLLRTATVHARDWDQQWLFSSTHRQLLGASTCKDVRWSLLCAKAQLMLQLQEGYTVEEGKRLIKQLHRDQAVISGYLPQNTWLVLAEPGALQASGYLPHALLPYAPEYKVAPEWQPVMELVHEEQHRRLSRDRDSLDSAAAHVDLHRRVVDDELLQQLQLHAAPQQQDLQQSDAEAAEQGAPSKILIGVHFPDIPQSELARLGVDNIHPAAAAAADWGELLVDLVAADGRSTDHIAHCRPEMLARGPWELDVAVCPQDLAEVLFWLSNQAVVNWVAPRPRLFFQNSVASMIVQDNGAGPDMDYDKPGAHAFWEQGLNGTGQIIGIGDSGIDMHSCFFRDPAIPFEPPSDGTKEWKAPNHRKVVYYWGLADNMFRDLVGHGTHTSGSLAGLDPSDPGSKATGAAKGARLAFADLSTTASGDVNAPQDMATSYFPNLQATGAFIFSDSWGSSAPQYDFQASKVDSWLYNNQDCLSHFAAGNYGEDDSRDSTITSPATAKNVVTVGATKSRVPNYISQTIAPVFRMTIEIRRQNKASQFMSMRLVKADFGGDGSNLSGRGLPVVRADPPEACTSLVGDASKYKDAIVLVRRGQCYFSVKMSTGAAAGAAALVIVNNLAGGYFKMDAQSGDSTGTSTIPLLAMPRRRGEELWALFNNADSIFGTIELYSQTWEAYEDIASFSSFGPTLDGRVKPDVVCPGELVSASSADTPDRNDPQETCGKGRKSGTSMATPIVAGHAAIIRQYFMMGFYPTGSATPANSFIPSGPLMKAIMVGGACDMKGNTEQYLPLESSPSMRQGFGRLCLCNSLKLAGRCDTNLQVLDRVPISAGKTDEYCLSSKGGDVRITLVWYDYPAQPNANSTLVNDLDLTVTSAGMGGQSFFGNMGIARDQTNTVERVSLLNVPAGGLDIKVTAQTLSPLTPSQNYSLVVQGTFDRQLASTYNPDKSAASLTAGRCPSSLMQSVTESGGGTPSPRAAVGVAGSPDEGAANVSSSGQKESAVVDTSKAARVEVAPAVPSTPPATPIPPTSPLTPPPAATPAPPPSKSPGGGDDLLGLLIGTMTGSAPAASSAPGSTTAAPPGAPGSGRRLTWVPTPPASVSVRVPSLVCQWLSASGLASDMQPEQHTMDIPIAVVFISCAALALAVATIVAQSMRSYRLGRTASLTTAMGNDLVRNKKAAAAAAASLKEALLKEPGLASHLDAGKAATATAGAATATAATSRKGPSRSHSLSSNGTSSSGGFAGAVSETPSSAAAGDVSGLIMQRSATTPPRRVVTPDSLAQLASAGSCPAPPVLPGGSYNASPRSSILGDAPAAAIVVPPSLSLLDYGRAALPGVGCSSSSSSSFLRIDNELGCDPPRSGGSKSFSFVVRRKEPPALHPAQSVPLPDTASSVPAGQGHQGQQHHPVEQRGMKHTCQHNAASGLQVQQQQDQQPAHEAAAAAIGAGDALIHRDQQQVLQ